MKKSFLLFMVLFACINTYAQVSITKIWESDTTATKGPESALPDLKSKLLYVTNMGSGTISQLSLEGKTIKKDWITGLSSGKGSGIYKDLLYVAETKAIAVIDVAKGSVEKRIAIEGAGMLNDITIDAKGTVYFSDTRTGKVYKLIGDKPVLYLENITGVNGLLAVNTDLYVVGAALFEKVSADKQITKIADGFEGGLDGIVMVSPNDFILSNYRGMLYYVNANGNKTVLQDTRTEKVSCNDISYNEKTKTLYVASYSTNKIIAYKVN